MSKFIQFSPKQLIHANNTNLELFLRANCEELIKSGSEWRWKRHDSVTLKGNRWYRHSKNQGGLAISFIQEFYNLSFPDAVTFLLDGYVTAEHDNTSIKAAENKKLFRLPMANRNMQRVYAYLIKQRSIDRNVIHCFAHENKLFEDVQYHNAVFVGFDESGIPRHAHKRSTSSGFRGNIEGSDSRYAFCHNGPGETLYVFEAPIDMLSYITLIKDDWQQNNFITLYGVTDNPLLHFLFQNTQIKNVVLCLDNDTAGISATERISANLRGQGYCVTTDIPKMKDWNEQLLNERNMIMNNSSKPNCPLIGADGNIFNLMGIASRTLKENDMADQAKEMCTQIINSGSYAEALNVIGEYVNIIGTNEEMHSTFNMNM